MQNLNDAIDVDVIIVLGAAQYKDGRPGPAMARRMASAIGLMQQGVALRLLLSGGVTSTTIPEAETMRHMALAAGISEESMICETKSRNTLQNAVFCARIIKARNFKRCLLVTDDFHMSRAIATFRAMGVPARPSSVAVPLTMPTCLSYARELAARVVYPQRIRTYLKHNYQNFGNLGTYDEFETK